jgi:CheY-like chemotaxis protein/class 3 adenylate cyclase
VARRTVLMASGSPLFGRPLTRALSDSECDVVPAQTPEDIRKWVASGSVQLCVIQDELRGASGLDLVQELSQAHPAVPIVVFSRDATAESTAKERGAVGFIKVPLRGAAAMDAAQSALALAAEAPADAAPPPPTAAPAAAPVVAAPIGAAPTAADEPIENTGGGHRILLVDDSKVIHTHVGGLLSDAGYEVSHAMDGLEGLHMVNTEPPDLIISDVEMPEMDGFEMCYQIKEDPETGEIPLFILSSRAGGVDIDRGFDVGANDYLTKPVDEQDLLSRLEQTLGTESKGKREKIVVAEDSLVQRNLIVQGLEKQGFDVRSGKNGQFGLDLVLEDAPDLIITDSDMPVMDGRAFTREVRKHEHLKDVPVVMLTATDTVKERSKGKHAGVNAYLAKPFVPDKIIVIAERMIAAHRLKREGAAMQRYMSDSAIEAAAKAAHAEGDDMHAERRFVTTFFTDIVGFTPMTESMEADALVTLLNDYFDTMTPFFKENGGIIDKFIGDCIMAVFYGDDDAANAESALGAVKTGLMMTQGLAEFNAGREVPIDIRVGINSGDVIMGDIGAAAVRRDHTVIGDHVNLAALMESSADHGTVFISQHTHDLISDRVVSVEREPVAVKGKSEPVRAYRVDDTA